MGFIPYPLSALPLCPWTLAPFLNLTIIFFLIEFRETEAGLPGGQTPPKVAPGSRGSWTACSKALRGSAQRQQGPWRYLEAVEDRDVDLHQRLVLPQGRRLPHVQVHLLGHFLKEEGSTGPQAGTLQAREGQG